MDVALVVDRNQPVTIRAEGTAHYRANRTFQRTDQGSRFTRMDFLFQPGGRVRPPARLKFRFQDLLHPIPFPLQAVIELLPEQFRALRKHMRFPQHGLGEGGQGGRVFRFDGTWVLMGHGCLFTILCARFLRFHPAVDRHLQYTSTGAGLSTRTLLPHRLPS